MRTRALIFGLLMLSLCPLTASAETTHVVAQGHTLGKIAKRYHVSIEAICEANHINRHDSLKIGQKLVIPDADKSDKSDKSDADKDDSSDKDDSADKKDKDEASDDDSNKAAAKDDDKSDKASDGVPTTRSFGSDGLKVLEVPGHGDAYFYEPTGPGRKHMKPVIMYLHGRGGHPAQDCRKWATVARHFGWLVCPSGPSPHGDGRDWDNNCYTGQQVAVATVNALRKKFGRRVQLMGNTLIGFSEGAYVALNVGVREPRTFNRWLILAGNTSYWGGAGLEELQKNAHSLRRVYLITGEQDSVIEGTNQLRDWLEKAKVPTRISEPKGMGHEVALDRKPNMYRAALAWLDRGVGGSKRSSKASAKSGEKSRKRH